MTVEASAIVWGVVQYVYYMYSDYRLYRRTCSYLTFNSSQG